jgi:hypothetical protein
MNKIVNQIKDVNLIEKELDESSSGVLAFMAEEDKLVQIATNYLYKDKNIFIFFSVDDELYETIKFDSYSNFTVIKNEVDKLKDHQKKKHEIKPKYYLFSITVKGIIRQVEEKKLIESCQISYTEKYSKLSSQESIDFSPIQKVVIIDSEEIQAFEELGN